MLIETNTHAGAPDQSGLILLRHGTRLWRMTSNYVTGGVAERLKATVLKTVERMT